MNQKHAAIAIHRVFNQSFQAEKEENGKNATRAV